MNTFSQMSLPILNITLEAYQLLYSEYLLCIGKCPDAEIMISTKLKLIALDSLITELNRVIVSHQ